MKNFVILVAIGVLTLLSCKTNTKETDNKTVENTTELTSTANTVSLEVKIEGMTCSGCEQTIENAVKSLDGVKSVDASHTSANAIIELDPTLLDTVAIQSKIDETGYKTISFVTDVTK